MGVLNEDLSKDIKRRIDFAQIMTELVKNKYGDELRQYFDKEINK